MPGVQCMHFLKTTQIHRNKQEEIRIKDAPVYLQEEWAQTQDCFED